MLIATHGSRRPLLVAASLAIAAQCGVARAEAPPAPAATTAPLPVAAPAPVPPESPVITIEEATKGLKGKGTLQATISVEGDGIKGQIVCALFDDKAPITVANFVGLARGLRRWKDPKTGQWVKRPLYEGTLFHRVIPNFMIQGGDPDTTSPGRGGPGYEFDDEVKAGLVFDKHGVLAMANKKINRQTGHGTNGSQFFITDKEAPFLNGAYSIFGQCDAADLVAKIARMPTTKVKERPDTDVVIKKIAIQRVKAEAK